MQARTFSVSFFLVCFLCLSSQSALAKKMYRWVNENGETIFSDQVPPEQSQLRRESLNEKGRVVEVTEKEKTKEQQAIDNRLNALKKAQEKIIAQQAANDKVLLSTFRNVTDMEASLYATLQSLDAQRNVAQGNLKRVEDQLASQQKKAAELERNGKKVPKNLLDEIKQTEERRTTQIHRKRPIRRHKRISPTRSACMPAKPMRYAPRLGQARTTLSKPMPRHRLTPIPTN